MKFEYHPWFTLDQNDLQDHRRARPAPGSLAFPSVRASARHDGQRLHECGIQDREALVQAGALLVEIGDSLNQKVVADLLSADAAQIEKGAAVQIDGWGGTALQVTRVDPAGFLKVSALLRVPRVVASALYEKPSTYGLFCPFCAPPRSVPDHSLSLGLAHDRWVSVRVMDVSIRCN